MYADDYSSTVLNRTDYCWCVDTGRMLKTRMAPQHRGDRNCDSARAQIILDRSPYPGFRVVPDSQRHHSSPLIVPERRLMPVPAFGNGNPQDRSNRFVGTACETLEQQPSVLNFTN